MYRRGGCNNLQSWKERFVELMKDHKPQDKWTLDLFEDLSARHLQSGWYTYDQKQLFARFECSICLREWKSIQVVIRFHMRLDKSRWGQSQGQVKVRIFSQKCRRCTKAKYEEPIFSEEAVQKLLHNLSLKILEKCYGQSQKSFYFLKPDVEENVEGPHDRDNCEACKEGICLARLASTAQPTQQEEYQNIFGFLLLVLLLMFFFAFFAFFFQKK
uniref:receptor-transporting protein 3-like n=1 Tax=Euleptes europaea TaxID=460621 RepID=UPI00254265B6|nr:receptor-transporting protein 3-like [Euleptes europaea]